MSDGGLMGILVVACGAMAVVIGGWRSYAMAREALAPLAHDGDPTRTAIEAAQPLSMRPRVRLFARRVALSIGWLIVSFYGLYLVVAGQELAR
jgi:hypothetical protein